MNSLFDSIAGFISNLASSASTYCMFVFFEPEVPKSLREE
ncbi:MULTISPECIES: cyclic lactone autoinducer peptide [unclassified Romboutsia]|nr:MULTISPECIES: cyclic lactone autoinducer peptide [unclassified Romboutsia]SCI04282.1 cyclic lactone autoinducer peptide [uncultured Clostridium sp.]